ncbi:hypothetical protein, partial [Novipirellula maiorica]|uniref:hypothetical protein n=1 Tax=Novipirellula maiorica TaxID=1265734 RepID=UPI001F2DC9F1
ASYGATHEFNPSHSNILLTLKIFHFQSSDMQSEHFIDEKSKQPQRRSALTRSELRHQRSSKHKRTLASIIEAGGVGIS